MEKAYDVKELGKRLKEKGLIHAEDVAGDVYVELKAWLKESAVLSKDGLLGKLDDLVMPFLDQLDPVVLPQIDKIDGQVG